VAYLPAEVSAPPVWVLECVRGRWAALLYVWRAQQVFIVYIQHLVQA